MQQNSKGNSNYKIKNTTHTPCTQSHNTHTHTHTADYINGIDMSCKDMSYL